jgi:hypothetical protein
MNILSRHPWFIVGLGVIAGYHLHKYRKEIIESARQAAVEDAGSSDLFATALAGIRNGVRDAAARS